MAQVRTTEEKLLGYFGAKRMDFLMNNYGEVYERAFLEGALVTHCRRIQKAAESKMETVMKDMLKNKWPGSPEERKKRAEERVLKEIIYTL